ncbi:alpha-D-xyloside xylohydrolase [Rhizobiales bacterium GAS191]|nr:alpha-D-xyloside xylohydrolase [Rhizobiales bacterium GAS191]
MTGGSMEIGFEPNWSRFTPVKLTGDPEVRGANVIVPTSEGPLALSAGADYFRLTLGSGGEPAYPMLIAEPPTLPIAVEPGAGSTVIAAGPWRLVLGRDPLTIDLTRDGRPLQRSASDGHFVREHRLPPFARLPEGWLASLELRSGERVYGLGEKWGKLDKRGSLIRSHTFDALGVNAERSYKNTPFAWSPSGWGLFVHTPASVTHGVGHPLWSQRAYVLAVEEATLDLFFLAGADGPDLLRAYTGLTGRAPAIPDWSFGPILSKAYYRTADELLATAREVRARGMPCTTITLDGRAWQDTDTRFTFDFDRTRYRNPKAVLDELKGLGFRICVWEYPLVSVNGPLFARMAAEGWLIKDRRTGEPYRYEWDVEPFGAVLTPLPASGLVDFTHPGAFAFWRDSHKALFDLGVDMIKPDFGEQIEDDCLAHNGDCGKRLHNVYPLLYNRCVHEAAERYCASGAFLFSRSAWAGSQRFPGQWGGDPQADFEGLAASIRGGLSWGMSGAPFHAHDVGGFYGDRRDAELYVRWTQAALFFSHLRFHGVGPREPWSYGKAAEAAVMKALGWRMRLIPYLRRAAGEASRSGMPVQRAMALACPDDPAAFAFEEQFFCGPDIVVAPCIRPDGEVTLYLPRGAWRRFPDGDKTIVGGRALTLRLALDEVAAFVREGAAVLA